MRHTEYYNILEVATNATPEVIQKAYRKKSLQWHPDRNQTGKELATKRFQEISEAYQILSDPEKREIYNKYGKEVAQGPGSVPTTTQTNGKNVRYHFSSNGGGGDVFQSFFGMNNNSSDFDMNGFTNNSTPRRNPTKTPILQRDVNLTLEQLASGCQKRLRLTSKGIYGNTLSKIFTIDVKPGWKAGTKITFPYPEYGSDVEFTVRLTPHAYLTRDGHNLRWQCILTSVQAKKGLKITIKTPFPNEEVDVSTKGLDIYPGRQLIITGKGMPIKGNLLNRGDLIVRFMIR